MELKISSPISENDVRKLKIGDVVYVSGVIHTIRDMGYRRFIEMMEKGETAPFNLQDGAIWHCGPIAQKNRSGKWELVSASPTSSSRFTELGAKLVKQLRVRLIIGKGTMGDMMIKTLKDIGGAYLVATGGCGALYAKQILSVENVHWLDLGMPEAVWVLKVKDFGPLIVGIDSNGATLAQTVIQEVHKRVKEIYASEKIDPNRSYVWWPKKVAGS